MISYYDPKNALYCYYCRHAASYRVGKRYSCTKHLSETVNLVYKELNG